MMQETVPRAGCLVTKDVSVSWLGRIMIPLRPGLLIRHRVVFGAVDQAIMEA